MDRSDPLYRIRKSKRAKRLALRLDPIERVFDLVIPSRCSLEHAYDFAEQYEEWMRERISALPPLVLFTDGSVIPLNGKNVTISIHMAPERKTTKITLQDDDLVVITNKADPAQRIKRWLKAYAKEVLTSKSYEKLDLLNSRHCEEQNAAKKSSATFNISGLLRYARNDGNIIQINKVSVRDTKSRWGSCSVDDNLSYSWRLIFAPPAALDYVVAHEVAHLHHHDHSKAFWNLCRELSDNYLEGQYWMKAHGGELMRYG